MADGRFERTKSMPRGYLAACLIRTCQELYRRLREE